jgi:hypothetical protein
VVFSGIGVAWLTVIGPGAGNWVVFGPYLCLGIGIGVCFGVMDGAAVSSVEPGRAGMAAGMYNTMRLGGEAVGIALVGTLLAGITGSNLASRITGFNTPYASHPQSVANLVNQGNMGAAVRSVNPPSARADFQSVLSDSYTGALHVTLWSLAGLCLVIAVILALLDRPAKPQQQSAPSGGLGADVITAAVELPAG